MDKLSFLLKEKMETHAAQKGKGCYLDLGSAEPELLESWSVSVVVRTSVHNVTEFNF